jgi:hypothetical protein
MLSAYFDPGGRRIRALREGPAGAVSASSRRTIEYILRKHVQTARQRCPSLATKRVFPHLLRHTCALTMLQATKDLRKSRCGSDTHTCRRRKSTHERIRP